MTRRREGGITPSALENVSGSQLEARDVRYDHKTPPSGQVRKAAVAVEYEEKEEPDVRARCALIDLPKCS